MSISTKILNILSNQPDSKPFISRTGIKQILDVNSKKSLTSFQIKLINRRLQQLVKNGNIIKKNHSFKLGKVSVKNNNTLQISKKNDNKLAVTYRNELNNIKTQIDELYKRFARTNKQIDKLYIQLKINSSLSDSSSDKLSDSSDDSSDDSSNSNTKHPTKKIKYTIKSPNKIIVKSMTNPSKIYNVDTTAMTCTCPHFTYRNQICKHLKSVT